MPEGTQDCLFCRILAGDVPSKSVAANEHTYAFRDIEPAAPVHVLVVPRRHIASAAELGPFDGDLLVEMFAMARRIAEQEGIADSGFRMIFNVGEDALNSVPHLHLHVLGGRR